MELLKAQGPICPYCGCNDARVIQAPTPGGWYSTGKARCKHCGRGFSFRYVEPSEPTTAAAPVETQEPAPVEHQAPPAIAPDLPDGCVPFLRTVCPECGSDDTLIKSTSRPIRKHKCKACNASFKSHEGDRPPPAPTNPTISPVFSPRV